MPERIFSVTELLLTLKRGQDVFRRHVIPILDDDERGIPRVFGTALVVSSDQFIFLVSAAHVFEASKIGRLYFYSDTREKRALTGELRRLADHDQDRHDVAVLKLAGEPRPPFPATNCFPLPMRALMSSNIPRDKQYYLTMGYPTTKTTANTNSKVLEVHPYANFGPSLPDKEYKELSLDAEKQIAIKFHKKNVRGATGLKQTFPDPNGMSGSPIWLLYDGEKSEDSLGPFPVVGILTDYRARPGILLGVDIGLALKLITQS